MTPDLRAAARLAAEWDAIQRGFGHDEKLLAQAADMQTARFLELIDRLASDPEMQALCARRRAMQLLEAAGDQHA